MELVTPDWGLLFFILIVIGGAVAFAVFFLLNLGNALKQCSPETRKMPPGQVWLTLIPLFGVVWYFIVVSRIADSLAGEFARRRMPVNEARPGYGVGLAMSIAGCGGLLRNFGKLAHVPLLYWLGIGIALVYLVLVVVYWVQIAGYKNQLIRSGHFSQFGSVNPHHYSHPGHTHNLWSPPGTTQSQAAAGSYGNQYTGQNQLPNNPWPQPPQTPPPTATDDYSRFMPPGNH
ncbi:MAG: hypothetical protein IM638_03690 [Bacteroidetes bacterium]|nr:hypothetical protein [Bacteroidota bacterium]